MFRVFLLTHLRKKPHSILAVAGKRFIVVISKTSWKVPKKKDLD